MATTRLLDENGQWQKKTITTFVLDENGNKIPQLDENGQQVVRNGRKQWKRTSINNPLNNRENVEKWRCEWEAFANAALAAAHSQERIDHRSLYRQGKVPRPLQRTLTHTTRGVLETANRTARKTVAQAFKAQKDIFILNHDQPFDTEIRSITNHERNEFRPIGALETFGRKTERKPLRELSVVNTHQNIERTYNFLRKTSVRHGWERNENCRYLHPIFRANPLNFQINNTRLFSTPGVAKLRRKDGLKITIQKFLKTPIFKLFKNLLRFDILKNSQKYIFTKTPQICDRSDFSVLAVPTPYPMSQSLCKVPLERFKEEKIIMNQNKENLDEYFSILGKIQKINKNAETPKGFNQMWLDGASEKELLDAFANPMEKPQKNENKAKSFDEMMNEKLKEKKEWNKTKKLSR